MTPGATICDMCYAPLNRARPSGFIRTVEVAGGVLAVLVVVLALWTLRDRFTPPPAGLIASASPTSPPAIAQLALGGSATPLPTLSQPLPTLTRVVEATATPVPPSPEPTATLTPRPQTGGRETSGPKEYIIQSGDTLLAIAYKFGVSLDNLISANNLGGPNTLLLPGKALTIPQSDAAPNSEGNQATPTSEQAAQKSEEPPATEPTERVTYTVRSGDVLGSIASRFNKTAEEIARLNNFRSVNDMLQIGQVLVIEVNATVTPRPPTDTPPPPPPTATPAPTNTAAPTSTSTPTSLPQVAAPPTPGATEGVAATSGTAVANQAKNQPGAGAATGSGADTGAYRYPAPALLGVPNKTKVQGKMTPLLNWTSVGVLSPDEYYVVKISAILNGKPVSQEAWTKATGWRLADELKPDDKATEPTVYIWEVVVKRVTARTPDGQPSDGVVISPASATQEFSWAP